jgi:hypothetical protein
MRASNPITYIAVLESDSRLPVWHLSLIIAILHLSYKQGQIKIINASRRKLMSLSHIKPFPPIINTSKNYRISAISDIVPLTIAKEGAKFSFAICFNY